MSNSFSNLIRERRQELGSSLSVLAAKLGVTKSYLSMLETGRRSPADEHFDALANLLQIPTDVLRTSAGKLPPDVAIAVHDYAETIVSTIRRDDAGARISFSDSLTNDFQLIIAAAQQKEGPSPEILSFMEPIRAGKNSTTYRAHSYHTKVPPEAIEKLIRHHTLENQIVVDPFCGSGMAGVAAMQIGRHAVLSDLSPAAVHISQNYTTPCDVRDFLEAVRRVHQRVTPMMSWLYEFGSPSNRSRVEYTVWSDIFACPQCGSEIVYWEGARDPETGAVMKNVICPSCEHNSEKRVLVWVGEKPVESNTKSSNGRNAHPLTNAEIELIHRSESTEVLSWIPQVPFTAKREMWRAGHTAMGITKVSDFYTKRNLHALAAIRHAINEEKNGRLRSALLFAFTAVVNRASKRYQWNVKRPTNVMTGTLYVSSLRYEWNVWSLFERKTGDISRYYQQLGNPKGKTQVVQASATSLDHLPDQCTDYVFMDPPFGSNIFYADSSLLWEAWLGTLTEERQEIVVNKKRTIAEGGKTIDGYQKLMAKAFQEVARILKPSAYATLQFNNSSDEVWCAIQDAVNDAGLEVHHAINLDKIHSSIKGVKGKQAKEDVASLDALIELRRKTTARPRKEKKDSSQSLIREMLNSFAASKRHPFSTDEAFSHVVQNSLTAGVSLSGVSIQTIKSLCEELFSSSGSLWKLRNDKAKKTTELPFEAIESPYGCIPTRFLASEAEIISLIQTDLPAPTAHGAAPRVVSGQRNTALYNAHSYHTKIPPEAIAPFIKHFTRPGDLVLDPFCGTGMTGVAALLTGRRSILNDLSVVATHLTYNHTRPCDPTELSNAFNEIVKDLDKDFREIYACHDGKEKGYLYYTLWSRNAICPHCGNHFPVWEAINRETGRMPTSLKCPKCMQESPKHGLKYAGNVPVLLSYKSLGGGRKDRLPTSHDLALIDKLSALPKAWYPKVQIDSKREMYIRSALHLQGIQSVADFYTTRNLLALSLLWKRIQEVDNDRIRAALTFAFTNTAWHGTRMRRFNARGGHRPLTGTLYIPQISSEANVLEVMRNKIRQLGSYYSALGEHKESLPAIMLGSATNLAAVPTASIDYVFTDPPFGSNIFYADCNLILESWLGGITRCDEEAVVNKSRDISKGGKSIADYQHLMGKSMLEIHRVLKPGAWATLVFHNTDPAVWRAIQSAAENAGFQIEDAGTLDRKQQSHKGYKGRSEDEDVAHFDVIMSMRKVEVQKVRSPVPLQRVNKRHLISEAAEVLPAEERTIQRVHSEVIQRLAREGLDLGCIDYDDIRDFMSNTVNQ